MKIKKGDTVFVETGKDRAKRGKVVRVYPDTGRVLVEGINQKVRHVRPRRAGEKGQRVTVSHPIPASNVLLVCPHCSKTTRVGYRIAEKEKVRVCKKCGGNLT
ncbi:MAG: 50S ribosomal protein L24 [Candidatus Ryanbacteria bacterium]|nr:50S ribosomal protein L24 [Candidatus Ryanbacteria bacterium]